MAPANGCHNCKHAHIEPSKAECWLNPPQVFLIPAGQGQVRAVGVRPTIEPAMMCGQWKLNMLKPG